MDKKSINILVLDDDALIASDIASILEDDGYAVITPCHDYNDALNSIKRHKIDLAVLDINLNDTKNGIDVAEFITANYSFPFIFLTSYSDEQTLNAAQEVSPFGYLVKPFQAPTLLSTVQIALSNFKKLASKNELNFSGEILSEREKDICKKLAEGKPYKDIADSEFISINTVRYHIKNLYVRYDVNSRSELVSKLIS